MTILELDETCKNIFQYLLMRNMTGLGPIRYNDLLENLKEKGLKISRPTLSEHLRHLVEKEIVTRTEVSRANVNYSVNDDRGRPIRDFIERNEKYKRVIDENKDRFFSDSVREQVSHLNIILVVRSLEQLKYEVLKLLEPENSFEYNLQIMSIWTLWDYYTNWFLSSLKDRDRSDKEDVVADIEDMIEKYLDITFEAENN